MTWGMSWGDEWDSGGSDVVHETRMASRVWTVLLRSTQFAGELIPYLAEQMQMADDISAEVGQFTPLSNSYGEQLRKWGQTFGLPRLGLTDEQWRQALTLKAASVFRGRSVGLVLEVADVITSGSDTTYEYRDYEIASYEMSFFDLETDTGVHFERILRFVKPEGVRFYAKIVEDSSMSFRFDTSGRGFDQGNEFAYTLET